MYQVKIVYEPKRGEPHWPSLQDKINEILASELREARIVNVSLSSMNGMTSSVQVAVILYELEL